MTNRCSWVTVLRSLVLLAAGVGSSGMASEKAEKAQTSDRKTKPSTSPAAEAIVRQASDLLKKAKRATVDIEREQSIGGQSAKTAFTLVFDRPNRLAIRCKDRMFGIDLVSDGKTVSVLVPPMQRYIQTEAPATFDGLLGDPLAQAELMGMMVTELCAPDPYAKLMQAVKAAHRAGEETIDGTKTHHLKFTQGDFDWEMWVAADGDPVVRRVRLDMSKALAQRPGRFKNQEFELVHNFKNWRFDPNLDDSTFAFQPPKGASKVASFFEGLPGVGAVKRSVLVGKPAPKDLSKESALVANAPPSKMEGLERAWATAESYANVATDLKGRTIFAMRLQGECNVLDEIGKITRKFPLPITGLSLIRIARGPGDSKRLIEFSPWGDSVLATKDDGTKLWDEPGVEGIDDVWPADLDGDGVDEVIVGYNGSGGLHVFAPDGKRLWKREDIGNVWHVTAGDLDGDGKPEVVTTSASGKVHVFRGADGKPLHTLDPGFYGNMVRTAPATVFGLPKGDVVLAVGGRQPRLSMAALGSDGKRHWKTELPADTQQCLSLAVSAEGHWAAAALWSGTVCVIDVRDGRVIAQVSDQGLMPTAAWATPAAGGDPVLVVSSDKAINAFRVRRPTAALSKSNH